MTAPFIGLNKGEEALNSIGTAIKIRPNYAKYHAGKGIILSELGFMEDALKSLDRAIELEPGNLSFYKAKKGLTALQKRSAK